MFGLIKFIVSVCAALMLGVLVLLFTMDLEFFSSRITAAVNEKIMGKIEIGELDLSILEGIRVKTKSISLKDPKNGSSIIEARSAYMNIPLLSLLKSEPVFTVVLQDAKVKIIKRKDGTINLLEAIKKRNKKSSMIKVEPLPVVQSSWFIPTAMAGDSGKKMEVPAFLKNAVINVRIENSKISIKDDSAKKEFLLENVRFQVNNLGFQKKMDAHLDLYVNGTMAGVLAMGKLKVNFEFTPTVLGNSITGAYGVINVDATAVELIGKQINKTKSMPMKLGARVKGTKENIKLSDLKVTFHTITLEGSGDFMVGKYLRASLASLAPIPLKNLVNLIPALKLNPYDGTIAMAMNVEGPPSQLKIKSKLEFKGVDGNLNLNVGWFNKNLDLDAGGTLLGMNIVSKVILDHSTSSRRFSFLGSVKNILINNVQKKHFPEFFHGEVKGTALMEWKLNGKMLPDIQKSITGTATTSIKDFHLTGVNVAEFFSTIFAKAKLKKKLKLKSIKPGFDSITMQLKFEEGVIAVNPIKMSGGKGGVDILGASKITGMEQDSYFTLHDPNRRLPKWISIGGKKPVLAFHTTGPLTAPKVDYEYTIAQLQKNILERQASRLLKSKKLKKLLKQTSKKDLKKKLKKLF